MKIIKYAIIIIICINTKIACTQFSLLEYIQDQEIHLQIIVLKRSKYIVHKEKYTTILTII